MQVLGNGQARGEVFVFQPRWLRHGDRPGRLPHRLPTLLGALRAAGWRVVLAEEAHDGTPELLWRERLARADLLVAWCAEMYPGMQIPGLLRFLEVAAMADRPPLVVGGGFFPLIELEPLQLGGRVDGIVLEPGEVVLPAVLEALVAGRPIAEVDGVCSWGSDGYRANAPPRRRALDAALYDVLPELDLARYGDHVEPLVFDNLEPAMQVPTGLGCAKRCAFCFDERSPFGVFSAPAVIDALRFLVRERGLRQVLLGELDFLHRRDRALEIVRGITELCAEVPDLRWFALGSVVDLVRWSEAELDALPRSNCYRIELGSESGSARMLTLLGKRHAPSDALEVTCRLAARGVRTTHNLLLGAPGETREDLAATLRFAAELASLSPLVRLQPRIYQVVPNTSLGAKAVRHVAKPPRSLEELGDYRTDLAAGGCALPWLEPDEERWVRLLADYVLPMAFERPDPRVHTPLRAALRALARLRCRSGVRVGAALERSLHARFGREHLPGTLVR